MSHLITLSVGQAMTSKFKAVKSTDVKQHFQNVVGGSFDKDAITKLLSQPGCTALRYYYGLNEQNQPVLVLVGVDSAGQDLTDGPMLERCKILTADQASGELVK